jgi:hypothetical protein
MAYAVVFLLMWIYYRLGMHSQGKVEILVIFNSINMQDVFLAIHS